MRWYRYDCPHPDCHWWREVPGLSVDHLWHEVDRHKTVCPTRDAPAVRLWRCEHEPRCADAACSYNPAFRPEPRLPDPGRDERSAR